MQTVLNLDASLYSALRAHLFPAESQREEVAFLYVESSCSGDLTIFRPLDYELIGADGFAHRSAYHLELDDAAQARVIKCAHDLKACLVEVHCHRFRGRAAFSPSDIAGLEEFVPHVWWRLKGRPYLALVFAKASFDSLAWLESPANPVTLLLNVDERRMSPTGASLREWGRKRGL